MRLSEQDAKNILVGLAELPFLTQSFEVFLFGSRTDPNKFGGDIDLLLVVPEAALEEAQSAKHQIIAQTKKYIDDQKIDVTIHSQNSMARDPFIKTVIGDLIRLK